MEFDLRYKDVEFVHVECIDLHGIARGFLADIDYYRKHEKSGFEMIANQLQLTFTGDHFEYEGDIGKKSDFQ